MILREKERERRERERERERDIAGGRGGAGHEPRIAREGLKERGGGGVLGSENQRDVIT